MRYFSDVKDSPTPMKLKKLPTPTKSTRPALTRPVKTAALASALAAGLTAGMLAPTPAHAHSAAPALPNLQNLTSSRIIDDLGRPTPHVQRAVADFAKQPWVPPQVRQALLTAVGFTTGQGKTGGPDLPANAPAFRQGYWPTVSPNCMGPGMHSTGSVIAVPGPAKSPKPAPKAGQSTFVFTALGTKAAEMQQGQMNVYWLNVGTLRSGVTPLGNNGINPTGPATLSGVASTGPGPVLAVVDGAVKTGGKSCRFAPVALTVAVK